MTQQEMRAMDIEIARRVCSWTEGDSAYGITPTGEDLPWPCYTTDHNAAFVALIEACQRWPVIPSIVRYDNGTWSAMVHPKAGGWAIVEEGPTAPLAICQALLAVADRLDPKEKRHDIARDG